MKTKTTAIINKMNFSLVHYIVTDGVNEEKEDETSEINQNELSTSDAEWNHFDTQKNKSNNNDRTS